MLVTGFFRVSHWPWAFFYRCQRQLCAALVLWLHSVCNSCQRGAMSPSQTPPQGIMVQAECGKGLQADLKCRWLGWSWSFSPVIDLEEGKLSCAEDSRECAVPGQQAQCSSKPRQKIFFASFWLLSWHFHVTYLSKPSRHLDIETVDLTAIKLLRNNERSWCGRYFRQSNRCIGQMHHELQEETKSLKLWNVQWSKLLLVLEGCNFAQGTTASDPNGLF